MDLRYALIIVVALLLTAVVFMLNMLNSAILENSQLRSSGCLPYISPDSLTGISNVSVGNYTKLTLYYVKINNTYVYKGVLCEPTTAGKVNVTSVQVPLNWSGQKEVFISPGSLLTTSLYNYLPLAILVFIEVGVLFRRSKGFAFKISSIGIVLIIISIITFYAIYSMLGNPPGLQVEALLATAAASLGIYCFIAAIVSLMLNGFHE